MSLFYSQSKILFLGLARYQDPSLLQLPCLGSSCELTFQSPRSRWGKAPPRVVDLPTYP